MCVCVLHEVYVYVSVYNVCSVYAIATGLVLIISIKLCVICLLYIRDIRDFVSSGAAAGVAGTSSDLDTLHCICCLRVP